MYFIAVEVFTHLCLFVFDYRVLFVWATGWTCLRIAIPAYYFKIFRLVFGYEVNPPDKV